MVQFCHACSNINMKDIWLFLLKQGTIFNVGKPHGIRTARKMRDHRRDQRWHDKDYKKSHLGTRWKANPFGGASHAKGIVLEKVYVSIDSSNLNSWLSNIVFNMLVISLLMGKLIKYVMFSSDIGQFHMVNSI